MFPYAGVRVMNLRLTAALVLVILIIISVSGCHFVTVHTHQERHGSAAVRGHLVGGLSTGWSW